MDESSSQQQLLPAPLPRRIDPAIVATAALSYIGTAAFCLTQLSPALRLPDDARFNVFLWLIAAGSVSLIVCGLRPPASYIAYAVQIAMHMGEEFDLPIPCGRLLLARRALWIPAGTAAACLISLCLAMQIGAGAGIVAVHGAGQHDISLLCISLSATGIIVRCAGPNLAELETGFRAAAHAQAMRRGDGGDVIRFPRSGT